MAFRFSFREAPPTGLILRNDRDNLIRGRIVKVFFDKLTGMYGKFLSISLYGMDIRTVSS